MRDHLKQGKDLWRSPEALFAPKAANRHRQKSEFIIQPLPLHN